METLLYFTGLGVGAWSGYNDLSAWWSVVGGASMALGYFVGPRYWLLAETKLIRDEGWFYWPKWHFMWTLWMSFILVLPVHFAAWGLSHLVT